MLATRYFFSCCVPCPTDLSLLFPGGALVKNNLLFFRLRHEAVDLCGFARESIPRHHSEIGGLERRQWKRSVRRRKKNPWLSSLFFDAWPTKRTSRFSETGSASWSGSADENVRVVGESTRTEISIELRVSKAVISLTISQTVAALGMLQNPPLAHVADVSTKAVVSALEKEKRGTRAGKRLPFALSPPPVLAHLSGCSFCSRLM